ncbi:MAG: exonuclease SbcCD subunit D C-terminal domain-containing protein [Deltaproteobacteria bacterium]|nr:exonuclease SbcCD subunit D C-terminal domain-containing protein [Deltaproteobacteria bacterium]
MRFIHTSDWHLGHRLHDASRELEHARFLDWLLALIESEAVDALLIAGDVFDSANPPASAQEQWYRFLAEARRRFPALDLVVIGGNHDSAARLDAPNPLLRALDVRLVGGLPHTADDAALADALLAPLHGPAGAVEGLAVAVPFLRPADLPAVEADDPLIGGVRAVYERALGLARERLEPGQALVGMGHCYMTGGQVSELSERKILGGNQHALPADIFPDDVAYVALGHLHLAQAVGREHVRYSGSPIPLSLAERRYPHQVVLVELDGATFVSATAHRVPRAVEILRVPDRDFAPLADVLEALRALPATGPAGADSETPPPFLEVAVALSEPEPALRHELQQALDGRWARLARISVSYTGHGMALGDAVEAPALGTLTPEQVLRQRYARDHEGPPPDELLAAFHELVDEVAREQEAS